MKNGVIICGLACIVFLLLAFIFAFFKGKAAMLISGFNTMSKEKRELYDKDKMSKEYRNTFLIWAAIMGIGAALSYCISNHIAIAAFVIWLILFFKNVHLDEEKAFGKYKR